MDNYKDSLFISFRFFFSFLVHCKYFGSLPKIPLGYIPPIPHLQGKKSYIQCWDLMWFLFLNLLLNHILYSAVRWFKVRGDEYHPNRMTSRGLPTSRNILDAREVYLRGSPQLHKYKGPMANSSLLLNFT